jgi:hypothetical protein
MAGSGVGQEPAVVAATTRSRAGGGNTTSTRRAAPDPPFVLFVCQDAPARSLPRRRRPRTHRPPLAPRRPAGVSRLRPPPPHPVRLRAQHARRLARRPAAPEPPARPSAPLRPRRAGAAGAATGPRLRARPASSLTPAGAGSSSCCLGPVVLWLLFSSCCSLAVVLPESNRPPPRPRPVFRFPPGLSRTGVPRWRAGPPSSTRQVNLVGQPSGC